MKSGDFCFAHMDCKHVMKKYSISEEGDKMNECECAGHRPRNGRLLHLLYAQESLLFVLPLSPLTSQSATDWLLNWRQLFQRVCLGLETD